MLSWQARHIPDWNDLIPVSPLPHRWLALRGPFGQRCLVDCYLSHFFELSSHIWYHIPHAMHGIDIRDVFFFLFLPPALSHHCTPASIREWPHDRMSWYRISNWLLVRCHFDLSSASFCQLPFNMRRKKLIIDRRHSLTRYKQDW